jgi:putative ABC transport system permease protein
MLRLLRLISWPQLRQSWGRTLLVVWGIATGVSLIVAINVVNVSVFEGFRRTIAMIAGPADLEITLGMGEVGFAEPTIDLVRSDPGVAVAVPLVRGTVSLADDTGETLQLFGVDLTAESEMERYRVALATERRKASEALTDLRSIFLTRVLASERGLDVGSVIGLATPRGVESFTVRGLLEPEGLARAFGGQLAVRDIAAAQWLLDKDGRIDQVDLTVRGDVDAVRARLEATLPRELRIARPEQRALDYERVLSSVQAMLTGISTLCLIAGVYIVYNTTSTAAIRRASVMAELQVLGANPQSLFRLLMLEALILGTIGSVAGFLYGLGLAWFLAGPLGDALGVIFQLRFPIDMLAIEWMEQGAIVAIGIAASIFASYFAARRVANLEVIEVLRADRRASTSGMNSRTLLGWWVALVVVSALALWLEVRFKSIAWGNFGASLWNASVIVCAVPIIHWLATRLARPLSRLFGPAGRMAAESITRSPTRAGVTAAAVAMVMGAAITMSSLSASFERSLDGYVRRLLAGDLIVSATATEGGWLETPLPDTLADDIQRIPGVRSVGLLRIVPGQEFRGYRIGLLALSDGLIGTARQPLLRAGDATTAPEELRSGRGVYVSTTLADRFAVHVGDDLALDTPTGRVELPVVAIVPDYISDRGSVILSRRRFVEHWRDRSVSRLVIALEPGASREAVRSTIKSDLGGRYRLKVLDLREMLAYHSEMIGRAFAFTDAIQLLIIIVTVAGIFDLLLSSITERRRELALWRVVGADEGAIRRSVIVESATIGCAGALLGVVLGFITAWMWVAINYRYLIGFHLDYHFALTSATWFAVLVVAMTILTGYGGAAHATRQPIAESIQAD